MRSHQKTFMSLFSIKQYGEALRAYVTQFTKACLEVPSASEEVNMSALMQGLQTCLLRTSLAKKPALIYDEVLVRC